MTLIADIQYFPSIILYKKLSKYSNIIFEQYDNSQKMSFRNRSVIAGAQGSLLLSIPLEQGRDQRTPLVQIRIANKYRWQDQHWKTLYSCYNRSPWFEYYQDSLKDLFDTRVESLVDWNLMCFKWTLLQLKWNPGVGLSDSYQPFYEPDAYTDWRGVLLPKTVQELSVGMGRYTQVFEDRTGYIPGLSILDLLFCEGPHASKFLDIR